ncbi:hypothetical protein GGI08_008918, partial [Coemansia sp. S2]
NSNQIADSILIEAYHATVFRADRCTTRFAISNLAIYLRHTGGEVSGLGLGWRFPSLWVGISASQVTATRGWAADVDYRVFGKFEYWQHIQVSSGWCGVSLFMTSTSSSSPLL